MDRTAVIAIVAVTTYILWLLLYLFIVEGWLRALIGMLLGVSIERRFERPVGNAELIDILFVFGWKVAEPAGWGIRFLVGFLRIALWFIAIVSPLAIAITVYLKSKPV